MYLHGAFIMPERGCNHDMRSQKGGPLGNYLLTEKKIFSRKLLTLGRFDGIIHHADLRASGGIGRLARFRF